MGAVFLMVLVFGGVITFIVLASRRAMQQRRAALADVAAQLAGTTDGSAVRGTLNGVPTTLRYATRGSKNNRKHWTDIECTLPAGYPLSLELHNPGWRDEAKVARGELIDVVTGDELFDRAFVVEGAPAEVVQRLLTPDVRAFLRMPARVELYTKDGTLHVSVRGWLYERRESAPALECAAAIAGGLRDATAAVDAAVGMDHPEGLYRGIPDDTALRESRAAREAEVADVQGMRDRRARNVQVGITILILVFVLVYLALVGSKFS